MIPARHFRFCPRCGAAAGVDRTDDRYICVQCKFLYFFGPTIAAGAFVSDREGRILFVERSRDPARGKLGVPGGFIDAGETAEAAVRRECLEEVGLQLTNVQYLTSHPNDYHFADITYRVLDLFFVGQTEDHGGAKPLDDVDAVHWISPHEVKVHDLAFPSIRAAFELYRSQ